MKLTRARDEHRSSEAKHLRLTFEALRVRINRPWFQSGILMLGSWRWDAGIHSAAEVLSDGGELESSVPRRPIGTLPVIPTDGEMQGVKPSSAGLNRALVAH